MAPCGAAGPRVEEAVLTATSGPPAGGRRVGSDPAAARASTGATGSERSLLRLIFLGIRVGGSTAPQREQRGHILQILVEHLGADAELIQKEEAPLHKAHAAVQAAG